MDTKFKEQGLDILVLDSMNGINSGFIHEIYKNLGHYQRKDGSLNTDQINKTVLISWHLLATMN